MAAGAGKLGRTHPAAAQVSAVAAQGKFQQAWLAGAAGPPALCLAAAAGQPLDGGIFRLLLLLVEHAQHAQRLGETAAQRATVPGCKVAQLARRQAAGFPDLPFTLPALSAPAVPPAWPPSPLRPTGAAPNTLWVFAAAPADRDGLVGFAGRIAGIDEAGRVSGVSAGLLPGNNTGDRLRRGKPHPRVKIAGITS